MRFEYFRFERSNCLLVLLVCVFGFGCSRIEPRPPASISGVVTLDGKPLESGSIQFTSLKTGEAAFTNVDGAGRFHLKFPEADLNSEYQVTINRHVYDDVSAIDAMTAPSPKIDNGVPRKYADRGTSGLTAQLTNAGENTINFDLTKK